MVELFNKLVTYIGMAKCPDCNGTGVDFGDGGQCDRCSGTGEIKGEKG